MKVLFVTPFLPSPVRFGGQRRIDGLMRQLAERHELSVLGFTATDEFTAPSLEATRAYCQQVVTFPDLELREPRAKRLLQARSLVSRHSFEHLLVARRPQLQATLNTLVAKDHFDIVQFEFAQMAAFELPQGSTARSVLDEHNIEFEIVKRTAAAQGSWPRRLYASLDWRKLAREERAAWRRFDGVCVTSQRDAGLLRQAEPDTHVAVIPNGVDVRQFGLSPAPPQPELLLFFGAMNYYPNRDGVEYLVQQILPRILAQRPNVKLLLVGPAPPSVQQLRSERIEVTDFVSEIEPYIDRASAVVVPLRLGGGTRLKILEAMAKGKPIVSTSIGAEGIDVEHGKSILLADDPAGFAHEVLRVLGEPELAARLGREARLLAEQRYDWPQLGRKLESFYEQLLQRPLRARA